MAITITTAVRNSIADAILALINAGTPPGNIQIGTTAFGTILATIALANPAFSAASGGSASLAGTPRTDSSADATGTAAVWRARDSSGTAVIDGTTVTSGAGADINLSTAARNAALNAINTAIGTSGKIEFTTAGDTGFASILASLPFNATAFAAASAGSMAMNASPAPTANATAAGTAALFRFTTSGGTEILRGSVSTSGADINFDSVTWGVGTPVTLNSYSATMAATVASSVGEMVLTSLSITVGQQVSITSGSFNQPAS